MLRIFVVLAMCLMWTGAAATKILIPMNATEQLNHLKAYGVMYATLAKGISVDWLLNYKGGSYSTDYHESVAVMCAQRGVKFITLSDEEYEAIIKKMKGRGANTAIINLEKAPKIAVYTPPGKKPWDDAVTLALTYAEIPFDKLYANEVLGGKLARYDWLHLHHEDFTGQYGKFWGQFHAQPWYTQQQQELEMLARKNGYKKVSQMQLAVVKKIRAFVNTGGNLFAMCSATDTYDIALAADGVDICDSLFDGDPMDPDAQARLDFSQCFAFTNFTLVNSPYVYEYSSIDNTGFRNLNEANDSFVINSFSVSPDPVPAMLTQNHAQVLKGFMGQTTAFRNEVLKPGILVLAGNKIANEARYIHGDHGKGTWTFYGGHDPEDYQHIVNDPVTDLSLSPNSPGYRLILNNVLFAAAKREPRPAVAEEPKPTPDAVPVPLPMPQRVKMQANADNTELMVSMDGTIKEVVVTDRSGKVVANKTFDVNKASISMEGLPPGLYEIRVNGEFAGRIMKE